MSDYIERAKRMCCEVHTERIEALEDALHQIETWSRAYPLAIFPEPDLKRAAELLKAGDITLDAVSANAMRHVVEGVGKIARAALGTPKEQTPDNTGSRE